MIRHFSEALLERCSDFVATEMGLYFPKQRWPDLENGLRAAARDFGCPDVDACMQWLLSARLRKNQVEILARTLTVGETYFYRDKRSFEFLETRVLPELAGRRQDRGRRMRLWSAGCCTGEEAYSLAMAVCRAIPDWKDWPLTILATDINPNFLKRAALGEYNEWSFRDAPAWLKETYFQKTDRRRFQIAPQIQRLVTFSYLNLADDTYPSLATDPNGMDVIFCRNVLMYFKPEHAERVARNLHRSLVDGGWLVVSPTEASPGLFSQFEPVHCDGVTFYRKSSDPLPAAFKPPAHELIGRADLQVSPTNGFRGAMRERSSEWSLDVPSIHSRRGNEADGIENTENPPPRLGGYKVHGPNAGQNEMEPAQDPVPTEPPEETLPVTSRTAFQAASVLFGEGRYSAAAEKLAELAVVDAASPEPFTLLARCCANLGRLTEARNWVDQAIARAKLNPGLHNLRATILQEQGNYADAASSLKCALYLDPDFVLAHFGLAHLELRRKQPRLATKHFENVLSLLNPHPPESVLPESDGMTAGRLREIVQTTLRRVPSAAAVQAF